MFSPVWLLLGVAVVAVAQAGERDQGLVLGDSVAFAYIASAGHVYINPENFVGFADDLANQRDTEVANGGCPGETTGSFLSATAPDNGCRAYRAAFPLHVMATARPSWSLPLQYLRRNRDVRFVTLTLGRYRWVSARGRSCATQLNPTACIEAGLPALLASVAANIATILADLRATGFGGTIVVTNYYSVDYSDPSGTALTALLNGAIATPAHAYGARAQTCSRPSRKWRPIRRRSRW